MNKGTTSGTIYSALQMDKHGSLYETKMKGGNIQEIRDKDGKYVKKEDVQLFHICDKFVLNNDDFKKGLLKIAFNYGIHNGLESKQMELIFDYQNKTFLDKAVIFPYVPMTPFDRMMEKLEIETISHIVRVFNIKECLFAYVELFNTFQYYILLSDSYDVSAHGDIDESTVNIIEKHEEDTDILSIVTPSRYKEIGMICQQYGVDLKKIQSDLVAKGIDERNPEFWNQVIKKIGQRAAEKIRNSYYLKKYKDIATKQVWRVDFLSKMHEFFSNKNLEDFYPSFQFYYHPYSETINLATYKKFLPDGSSYPASAALFWHENNGMLGYGTEKFHLLENFCRKNVQDKE